MFKSKRKRISAVVCVLVLAFSLGMSGVAQGATNTLSVQFKNLKVYFNGVLASLDTQPLVVNGTTYLPVRALSTIFDKNIAWNSTAQTITITDKTDSTTNIASLQTQIVTLKSQLAAAEEENDAYDLEDNLNDDYGDYKDLEWDISLDGNNKKVDVTVEVDLDEYNYEWDNLSDSQIKSLLQKIVDQILDESYYEDADITGEIINSDSDDILVEFDVDSKGNVSMDSASSLADLADELTKTYDDNKLGDIQDIIITLSGNSDAIVFTAKVKYSTYDDEWDELTDTKVKDFMKSIQNDIADEYDDADVEGYIIDKSNSDAKMAYLTISGSFSRYSAYPNNP